jgi:hypothetical protein
MLDFETCSWLAENRRSSSSTPSRKNTVVLETIKKKDVPPTVQAKLLLVRFPNHPFESKHLFRQGYRRQLLLQRHGQFSPQKERKIYGSRTIKATESAFLILVMMPTTGLIIFGMPKNHREILYTSCPMSKIKNHQQNSHYHH